MCYIVLGVILLIIFYLALFKLLDYDDESASALTMCLAIILALAPAVNGLVGIEDLPEYQEEAYTITGLELVNSQQFELKGKFILGMGTYNGKTATEIKYIFFANTEYGKQLTTTEITKIYIKETDEEVPKLINIKHKRIRKLNFIDHLWGTKGEEEVYQEQIVGQILVVPTNTIKIDYNIEI